MCLIDFPFFSTVQRDLGVAPSKQVCNIVSKKLSLPLYYIKEEYQPEVNEYRFEYMDGEKITKFAMKCDTIPSIFLLPGDNADEITAMTVKSIADNFRFITDDIPLTAIERGKHVLQVYMARNDGEYA